MLNVKKTHHYRIKGCEAVTDSSNRGSKISQLSNAVASEPKKNDKETRQVTEVAPRKGSKKEAEPASSFRVKPTPSVEEETSTGVEPQPSEIGKSLVPEFDEIGILKGPGEEPETKPSEVSVERELFQNPELDLDVDADRKKKITLKTKVVLKKSKKEVAAEEALVLHELYSLEDNFDKHLAHGKDVTKDVDIISQEIAYESFTDGNHRTNSSQDSYTCVICCRRDGCGYDK